MKRKDLQHIKLEKLLLKLNEHAPAAFLTAEGIELKQTYSEQDIENIKHLDFFRQVYPIYVPPQCASADLGLCQYAGFSTAEKVHRRNLAAGQKDFLSLLIYRHTAVMIRITDVWWEMWEKQELRSTLWKT
jgi:methylmalonyl-CoA mutase